MKSKRGRERGEGSRGWWRRRRGRGEQRSGARQTAADEWRRAETRFLEARVDGACEAHRASRAEITGAALGVLRCDSGRGLLEGVRREGRLHQWVL
jgi:hypothetical protein